MPDRHPARACLGPARGRRLALLLTTTAGACSFAPAPAFPRPALPLPDAIEQRFRLAAPPRLLHLEPRGQGTTLDGELACGDETIRFHLVPGSHPEQPAVLLVPILAGGDELMRTLALRFSTHGYQAIYCERVGPALRPPQRAAELELLFERTVRQQRAVLAWLATAPELRPSATFACGVSMGGMVTTVLAAVEPSLAGAAMCLAGADVPAILADSHEARIEGWRRWRRTADGIAGSTLADELRNDLRSDPLHLAPYVATESVFLVSTVFDDVVRPPHQQLLWEALGRPSRLSVPLGHYTAALALDGIVDAIAAFFAERQLRHGSDHADRAVAP